MKDRKKVLNSIKRMIEYEPDSSEREWIERKLAKWIDRRQKSRLGYKSPVIDRAVKAMLDQVEPSVLSAFGQAKKVDTVKVWAHQFV